MVKNLNNPVQINKLQRTWAELAAVTVHVAAVPVLGAAVLVPGAH